MIGVAALTVTAVGAGSLHAGDEGEETPASEPGIVLSGETESDGIDPPGLTEAITTGGTTYDPTLLTKFIPGSAFIARTDFSDVTEWHGTGRCITSDSTSAGGDTDVMAAVELPDGAKITAMAFYGVDDDAANITITLRRAEIEQPLIAPPIGTFVRSDRLVASFNTTGLSGVGAVFHDVTPDEATGSIGSTGLVLTNSFHRFHTVGVTLDNAATTDHVLCGVEIRYQVPTSSADAGTVFHPVEPVRAYDSRQPAFAESGLLAPNASKIISIKDGHDGPGNVTAPDTVPTGATAVAYNITITAPTGPNFVSVTPGDAAGFTASAVNFDGSADIANAGTVSIDSNRQIRIWGGDQAGSMHVIIDITGYYVPPPPFPNMGN